MKSTAPNALVSGMEWSTLRGAKITQLIGCDVDGTIANGDHRVHYAHSKEWDQYFALAYKDEPITHVIDMVETLSRDARTAVVFMSGRNEIIRADTLGWLCQYLPVTTAKPTTRLFMRREHDRRPDHVVKKDMLHEVWHAYGLMPSLIFDDRQQVVDMWRKVGIPCAQVAPGDF